MIFPHTKPITDKRLQQIKKGRNTDDYRKWRESVLARDKYKCQYPGCSRHEKLEVHHIRRFSQNKHLRTERFNGITLCDKCHDKITGQEERLEMTFFKIAHANEIKYKKELKEKTENESNN